MRDAMLAGATLNIFNNHADRVKMANLAQAVNVLQAVILTNEEKILRTPTFYVMKMYAVHHDARLVALNFQSPDYINKQEKLPAISASASIDASGKAHLSLVNIDAGKPYELELDLTALGMTAFSGEILAAANLQDHNTFEQPDKIQPKAFKDFKYTKGKLTLRIPPFSVVVLEGRL